MRDPRLGHLSREGWREEGEWRELVTKACFAPSYTLDQRFN